MLTEVGDTHISGKGESFRTTWTNELEKRVTSLRCFRGMGQHVITGILISMKLQDRFFSLQRPVCRSWWKWPICCAYILSESWQAECPYRPPHRPLQPCSKGSGKLWQRGSNRGACCWEPKGLWQWHCMLSSPAGWAMNVLRPNSVSSSHTRPLFFCYRDVV